MSHYLTAGWIREADAAVAGDERLRAATADLSLVVQQEVTDGPRGDVTYHVVADHGVVGVRAGAASSPTVTFRQSYETAAAVAKGDLSAQGAFMTGRIRVSGEVPQLVEHGAAFAGIGDVLGDLRARTTF